MNAPLFDLNYGLPNVQLKLEIPVEVVHEDSDGTAAGLGDLLLGVKWRFFEDEKSQIQVGIYPQALLPTGDHRPRRWPPGLRAAATGAKELGQMDALWQSRLLVANRHRHA